MRTTLDFTAHDKHQHDSRILPDGSIDVGADELLSLKAELWLANNAGPTPSIDGLTAREVLHESPHCAGNAFSLNHPRAKERVGG